MEKLSNLLFELSNEDRLIILKQLEKKPAKIAHISKKLNFTVQETSRNISRLSDAHLVERISDGSFKITEYGKNTLKFLPGLEFLSKHADHFTSHTLSYLPHEFFCRLGDLKNCSVSDDVMLAFYEIEKMMDEAEKFLWISSDQRLFSSVPHIKKALENGAKLRLMMPKDLSFPESWFEQKSMQEYMIVEKKARKEGMVEQRWLDRVDTTIGLSEKINGKLFFPTYSNDFDYKGFTVVDEMSHKFCLDLYEYYWNRASTRMPDHVLRARASFFG
jgi:predicted transcriptional regulator